VLLTSIGLAHHRLMEISGLPILVWFLARNLRLLRSRGFLLDGALCALIPLAFYLYLPLRAHEHPSVVESDTSHGSLPIIRGDLFASHEHAFTWASPGRWLHHLDTYGHLAVVWIWWPALLFALVGAAVLARRRPAIFVGLLMLVFTATWGLANRTDVDLRWLIVPILVVSLATAVGLEWSAQKLPLSHAPLAAAALAAVIPILALATRYSTYDRSSDTRNAENGGRILAALPPNAVVWAYWDVRTTLQYLTAARHERPDVTVLDHRAYAKYDTIDDATVALDVAADPAYAGRPYYFIPPFDSERAQVAARVALQPVARVDIPYGFDYYAGAGWLYRVVR
jgi:hypothetical protein